jgi:hypothetical protein
MPENISAEKSKDKVSIKKCFVNCLDHLVALIDNGGRRSWVERRKNSSLSHSSEKRSGKDRRNNIDRRKVQNQRWVYGSERRAISKNEK